MWVACILWRKIIMPDSFREVEVGVLMDDNLPHRGSLCQPKCLVGMIEPSFQKDVP